MATISFEEFSGNKKIQTPLNEVTDTGRAQDFLNKSTAGQIFSKEFLRELPKSTYETVVGGALKFIKSAVEAPGNITQSIQGDPITTTKGKDPITGKPITSFQSDFQNKIIPAVESGEMTPLKGTVQAVGAPVVGALDVLGADQLVKGGIKAAKSIPALFKGVADKIPSNLSMDSKISEILSSSPDVKTITILKETPREKFDEYFNAARAASTDSRKLTPLEVVGDKLSELTKQLQKKKEMTGKRKSEYVEGTRFGFNAFDTGPVVNKLTSLNNSLSIEGDKKLVGGLITKAKGVKTVRSADKFIDNVQEILYRGNKDLTIPTGSSVEKQLRGIISEMNNRLKSQLPKEYGTLNTKYSNLLKATTSLNRALGEKVEGVSINGASLIKQFFSPSGRRSKELFEFIKNETGVDLAQDATLAKFTMELFDDVRAKSLLEGIPRSASGLIDKVIDFGVDKTGAGEKLQEFSRAGQAARARRLTR